MLIFVATHSPIYFLPAISPALAEEGWGGFAFLRNNFPSSKAGTHLRAQLSLERWERGKRSCNLAIMELWLNFLLDFPMLRRVLLPTPTLTAFLTTAAAENPAVRGKKIQLYVKKNPAYMEKKSSCMWKHRWCLHAMPPCKHFNSVKSLPTFVFEAFGGWQLVPLSLLFEHLGVLGFPLLFKKL